MPTLTTTPGWTQSNKKENATPSLDQNAHLSVRKCTLVSPRNMQDTHVTNKQLIKPKLVKRRQLRHEYNGRRFPFHASRQHPWPIIKHRHPVERLVVTKKRKRKNNHRHAALHDGKEELKTLKHDVNYIIPNTAKDAPFDFSYALIYVLPLSYLSHSLLLSSFRRFISFYDYLF